MKTTTILCAILFASMNYLKAQTSGPNEPTNYSASGFGISWANLSGIAAVDNNPAYVDLAQYLTCNNQLCYLSNVANFKGFNFTVPANATITGIKLDIMQRVSSPGGGIHDSTLYLAIGTTQYGNDYANDSNWFDSPQVRTYGGQNDTWNHAWTPAEVNDPDFGLYYRLINSSYDQTASVDHMEMTIYYQIGNIINTVTSESIHTYFLNDMLYIENIHDDDIIIRVMDTSGKCVYEGSPDRSANPISLDVAKWENGIYLINFLNSNNVTPRKVALVH